VELKRVAKKVPPIRRLVAQRDSLKARLDANRVKLKRVRERARALEAQGDAQLTRIAELEQAVSAQAAELASYAEGLCYDADNMKNYLKNMAWMEDPRFRRAYSTGMDSGHVIGRPEGTADDLHIEWRVHVLLWAAQHALHLEGDFVECGVNTGIYSLAICDYFDFNSVGKSFYLFDTFQGIPESQMSATEHSARVSENWQYPECFETAQRNFAPYERAVLVRGMVPETLTEVEIDKVAYLSIDMNIAQPEIAAIEYFWDKLVSGAVVVLDDYGWAPFVEQQVAWDEFASGKGVRIATLPTGQGLLIKP